MDLEARLNKIRPGKISVLDMPYQIYNDCPRLIRNGRTFRWYEVKNMGKYFPVRQCHKSCVRIVEASKNITKLNICTGWAFDKKLKVWTRHSWVIHPDDKVLLEPTPFKRDEYFGVILTDKETFHFMRKWG